VAGRPAWYPRTPEQFATGHRVVALEERWRAVRGTSLRDDPRGTLKRARDMAIYDAKLAGWTVSALHRITGCKRDHLYIALARAEVLTEHEKRMARLYGERLAPAA